MTSTAEQICTQLEALKQRKRPLDEILSLAVELVHNSSPTYHWTGIYELFPDQVLRLGPFIGAPTNHVFICVGQGVCGSAVAAGKNMNIPDVSKADNYLACSEETRSELVVLIRKGDHIFAQIDIDSHELNAFEDAEPMVQAVADLLADTYIELQKKRLEQIGATGPAGT
jgi:GAF domain-containing protein